MEHDMEHDMEKISRFNVVEYLDSEEMIEEYVKAVAETGDAEVVKAAIEDVAQARAKHTVVNPLPKGKL
jgi:probable addiction module antidote protein